MNKNVSWLQAAMERERAWRLLALTELAVIAGIVGVWLARGAGL